MATSSAPRSSRRSPPRSESCRPQLRHEKPAQAGFLLGRLLPEPFAQRRPTPRWVGWVRPRTCAFPIDVETHRAGGRSTSQLDIRPAFPLPPATSRRGRKAGSRRPRGRDSRYQATRRRQGRWRSARSATEPDMVPGGRATRSRELATRRDRRPQVLPVSTEWRCGTGRTDQLRQDRCPSIESSRAGWCRKSSG